MWTLFMAAPSGNQLFPASVAVGSIFGSIVDP